MNAFQIWLVILVVLILAYELMPSIQLSIRHGTRNLQYRVKDWKAFLDDESYDIIGNMQHSPFTMSHYLRDQDKITWRSIRAKGRKRQRQGWGSPYFNGPDQLNPYEFWWQDGVLICRDAIVKDIMRRENKKITS